MEIWKLFPGTEYLISSYGRVKNKKGRILSQSKCNGYLRTVLGNKAWLVHRLVAITFIENKNNLLIVHHIDNNKQNNRVENLQWATQSYNVKKAYDDGLTSSRKGENNPNYKNGLWVK
jgi:hypothetical protein